MKNVFFIVLALACGSIAAMQSSAQVILLDDQEFDVRIKGLELTTEPICAPDFCEAGDTDCDGILDEGCPGLVYDPCEYGSIIWAYVEAAFTGQCAQDDDPEPVDCSDDLVVSPSVCGG